MRLDAASLASANVTRVTVEGAGQIQDLVRDPISGSYDGVLLLPSGAQTLVGHAFSNDVLVGASSPVAVDVTPGNVTRVMLRILDLTVETPVFGPLFDSLTYPTTISAGTTAAFALSVIAPAHDPVTYRWSSDCTDSTFTASDAATTGWSKPTQGSCGIDVVATSNGFSITQHFVIVVFPEGTDGGAVNVNGAFVARPGTGLFVQGNGQDCSAFSGTANDSSCPMQVAAPGTLMVRITVFDWGLSTPGSVALSDDCGGRFGIEREDRDQVGTWWMPPAAGGLCILTGRGTNSDGLTTSQSFAILTRPGSIPATQPPGVGGTLNRCSFSTRENEPSDCGQFAVNSPLGLQLGFDWGDGLPGIVTVTDDCGGGQSHNNNKAFLILNWTTSGAPGTTCHLTVNATNLQGVTASLSTQYHLF